MVSIPKQRSLFRPAPKPGKSPWERGCKMLSPHAGSGDSRSASPRYSNAGADAGLFM